MSNEKKATKHGQRWGLEEQMGSIRFELSRSGPTSAIVHELLNRALERLVPELAFFEATDKRIDEAVDDDGRKAVAAEQAAREPLTAARAVVSMQALAAAQVLRAERTGREGLSSLVAELLAEVTALETAKSKSDAAAPFKVRLAAEAVAAGGEEARVLLAKAGSILEPGKETSEDDLSVVSALITAARIIMLKMTEKDRDYRA